MQLSKLGGQLDGSLSVYVRRASFVKSFSKKFILAATKLCRLYVRRYACTTIFVQPFLSLKNTLFFSKQSHHDFLSLTRNALLCTCTPDWSCHMTKSRMGSCYNFSKFAFFSPCKLMWHIPKTSHKCNFTKILIPPSFYNYLSVWLVVSLQEN